MSNKVYLGNIRHGIGSVFAKTAHVAGELPGKLGNTRLVELPPSQCVTQVRRLTLQFNAPAFWRDLFLHFSDQPLQPNLTLSLVKRRSFEAG